MVQQAQHMFKLSNVCPELRSKISVTSQQQFHYNKKHTKKIKINQQQTQHMLTGRRTSWMFKQINHRIRDNNVDQINK